MPKPIQIYPNLRFFEVAKIVNGGVLINANDKPWKSAIPERIIDWSAVAFLLAAICINTSISQLD